VSVTERAPEREHPRYAHVVSIRVLYGKGKGTDGTTCNVSRGGLCAKLGAAIPVATDVTVHITVAFDDETQKEGLSLPARVAWCTTVDNEYQLGFSFKAMSAAQAERFQLFLRYLGEDRAPKLPKVEKSVDDQFR
jgi:hypothetical protein